MTEPVDDLSQVELRCPENWSKLLGKVARPKVVDGNLIEIACQDCKRIARSRGRTVRTVVHRFDVLGTLIETKEL